MPGLPIYPVLPPPNPPQIGAGGLHDHGGMHDHHSIDLWGESLVRALTRVLVSITTTLNAVSQTGTTANKPATPEQNDIFYTETDGLRRTYIAIAGAWVLLNGTGVTLGTRVFHSSATTVPDSTAVAITFNSERFDIDGMHSTATSASRLTCMTAGLYQIGGHVEWVAATGTSQRGLSIRINGTTSIAADLTGVTSGVTRQHGLSTIYSLAVDDYVELIVATFGDGTQSVNSAANYSPEFWAYRIGPVS